MRRRNIKGTPYVPDNAIVLYKTNAYGPNPNPEIMQILQDKGITDKDYMTKKECAAITEYQLGKVDSIEFASIFNNHTEITHFDEFKYFTGIQTIYGSRYRVGNGWFDRTNLKKFKFPNSVTYLEAPFKYVTTLKSVTIPDSVTELGEICADSNLDELIIENPNTISYIFNKLSTYVVGPNSKIKNTIRVKDAILTYDRFASNVQITDTDFIKTTPGCYIASGAFAGSETLTSCTISGNNCTKIGNNAFENCTALILLNIATKVDLLSENFIKGCSSLKSLDLSSCVFTEFPKSGTAINLGSVILPDTCKTLDNYAFDGDTKLYNINLSNIVTIGSYCFRNCDLRMADCSNATSISSGSFYNNVNMEQCYVTDKLTSIGNSAFENCSSLRVLQLPSSIKSIDDFAFRYCYKLQYENLDLSNCKYIGRQSFYGCDVKNVTLANNVEIWGNAFEDTEFFKNLPIENDVKYCGNIAMSTYEPSSGIIQYKPNTILCRSMNKPSFQNKNITLDLSNVIELQHDAFNSAGAIKKIIFPTTSTIILRTQSLAFFAGTSLDIPSNVDLEQADNTIMPFTNITTLRVDTNIGQKAFGSNYGITNLTIGVNCTHIGASAFSNNPGTIIEYEGSSTQWENIKKDSGWRNQSSYKTVHCQADDVTITL